MTPQGDKAFAPGQLRPSTAPYNSNPAALSHGEEQRVGEGAWLAIRFPSFWAVEDNPDNEVGRKVLEPMDVTGRDEQKRTGLDRVTPLAIEEEAPPASNEINLVSRVRLLGVVSNWSVEFHHERAVCKNGHCQIAGRWRPFSQGLDQANMDNWCGNAHNWLTRK